MKPLNAEHALNALEDALDLLELLQSELADLEESPISIELEEVDRVVNALSKLYSEIDRIALYPERVTSRE